MADPITPEAPPPAEPNEFKQSLGELAADEELATFTSTVDLAKAFKEAKRPQVVPEPDKYEIPEGFDKVAIGTFANKAKLSQETLSQSLEFIKSLQENSAKQAQDAVIQEANRLLESWGPEKDMKLDLGRRALRQFDPDKKFSTFLDQTGAGNHPLVIEFFASLGKTLQEDGFLKSEVHTPPQEKSIASVLYPNHKPE